MEQIKIKLDGGIMPVKKSKYAACYDVYCPMDYVIKPGRQIIDLGFALELPIGWHVDIRPRSGFSANGFLCERRIIGEDNQILITFPDSPIDADVILGTIDSDYRGHLGVVLNCHEYIESNENFVIPKGTRIAQMLIAKDEETELVEASDIDKTIDRGGGFGHSGTK